jgi:hypothetical protein
VPAQTLLVSPLESGQRAAPAPATGGDSHNMGDNNG